MRSESSFWRRAKLWAYIGVFIYSCLRALPLMWVEEFHGSVLTVWLLDVISALPYTWGVIRFVTGVSKRERYIGFLVALGTFAMPYVYFWTHGDSYPPEVIIIVVAMMLAALGLESYKYIQHKRRNPEHT